MNRTGPIVFNEMFFYHGHCAEATMIAMESLFGYERTRQWLMWAAACKRDYARDACIMIRHEYKRMNHWTPAERVRAETIAYELTV